MIKQISDNEFKIQMSQNYRTDQFIQALLYDGYTVSLVEVSDDIVEIHIKEKGE